MATAESHETPPPFGAGHTINLVSVDDSKIVNVSLYSGLAQITRLYKFPVKTGLNQVVISGLPDALYRKSLRVEGRGAATIHDVALSYIPKPTVVPTSVELEALLSKKRWIKNALERATNSARSLDTYLSTLNAGHINFTDLGKVMDSYDVARQKIDDKVTELYNTLEGIRADIKAESGRLAGLSRTRDRRLRKQATIGVFAEFEEEVEITLIYDIRYAKWKAGYDIRVDMQTKDKPITLIYKAEITQNTGEDWDDVPLTLETASPTFGVDIPTLHPWTLSVFKPITIPRHYRLARRRSHSSSPSSSPRERPREHRRHRSPMRDMEHRELEVSSKGNISATYRVPGVITIPSDNTSHNFTIVQLRLDASMSWVAVPKLDAKTHLKAKIKNASEYTLLQGVASIYVDGSFISRSDVPLVSPQESFDCPLGLDPSIRITYHPCAKNASRSGLYYARTSHHVFTQRITVFNTKLSAISDLKVIDQLPISESSEITVKLVSPGLTVPEAPKKDREGEVHALPAVKVGDGVQAQWEGADEQGFDMEHLGKDGKLYWMCAIPPQGKVNLLLAWEVSAPLQTDIVGL